MRIKEAVSKMKKRGRPEVFPEFLQCVRAIYPDVKTKRGLQNKAYQAIAGRAIGDDFPWLWDKSKGTIQVSILSELGRLEDPEVIRAFAKELCKKKPGAKKAVILIRRHRVGEMKPDPLKLSNELIHTLNHYLSRYPGTTTEMINDALRTVYHQVAGDE